MKILLSPAKTLDYTSKIKTDRVSQPVFADRANELNAVLKSKSPKQLMQLMDISDKLAELNWQRNQNWGEAVKRQAVFAFKGEVYVGLDAYTIDDQHFDYLQNTLRMLSGQYGVLKPFDLIKPYRLEMGTDLKVSKSKNLYQYWNTDVTEALNTEILSGEIVVNLASSEYFKVIKPEVLKATVITPVFKDYKNGEYKVISFYAKKARGLMSRFAIDNEIQNTEQLKTFTVEGYAYDEKLSSETEWVFTR